jgi:ribonuclease R
MLSESAILKKISQQPKRAAGYKQLARELGLRGEQRRELNDRLDRMVAGGQLVKVDGDRYALPSSSMGKNMIVGRLSMHRDGYGFVLPDPKSVGDRFKNLSGDIFIPPPFIGNAMHGDQVLVEVGTIRPDGRAEGRIIRPVNRAHTTVVGTFHYGSRYNYVTPIDEKIRQEVVIPQGMEYLQEETRTKVPEVRVSSLDANLGEANRGSRAKAKNVDRVLGDEAARRTNWDDLDGVIVDVEITDWPSPTQNPRGKVVEILGYEEDFGVDVEIMIRKHHLPHHFPPETLTEAQSVENVISAPELRKRRDYRNLPIVTIDGETARDFDDAVLVRKLDNGNYELQVHIADVAQYVTEDSALDQEARLRGTSVYFPDRAVPMLPLELSTDICSLRPKVDRLVLSCVMEIDHRGEVLGYEINEGVIRSAERMTYTAVNSVLEGDAAARGRYAALVPNFEMMRDLALILNRKRERRGSIDFDLPEPVIEFDENGLMKSITRSERNIAHRLIEEFMLAANESVAQYLENRRIASLYRIHEKPDAKRVYDFETIAATFGYSLGVGALPIQRVQMKTDRRSARGTGRNVRDIEIPKEVHITPRMYQKLTEKIAGKPEEQILSYLMLRSLKQARYSEVNEGHFALAAPTYTHFTSPIRRYPDLIVHRILKEVLHSAPERWEGEVAIGVWGTFSGATGVSPVETAEGASSRGTASSTNSSTHQEPEEREHQRHEQQDDDRRGRERKGLEREGHERERFERDGHKREEYERPGHERPGHERQDHERQDHEREGHDFSRADKPSRRKGASAPEGLRASAKHEVAASPWSKRRDHVSQQKSLEPSGGPISLDELHDIAEESSQSERRADDAERELMEWKKVKFMQERIGEVFDGLIISVTKFGLFVELNDLFVEGLVPLNTLTDDHYTYHENTREIIGQRSRKTYRLGQRVQVLVDRIDPVEKKVQFAFWEEEPVRSAKHSRRR